VLELSGPIASNAWLSSRRAALACAAAVGSISAVLLLIATHTWGLGVTYDSVAYMQASHRLSVAIPQPRDQGGQPLYWWGPVYPLVLKATGSSYSNARFVAAVLLLLGALVVGWIALRAFGPVACVVAASFYALSPIAFNAHLSLLAEPVFLLLSTAALGLLAEPRPRPFLAGAVTGLAVLTRYAGLPLIVVGLFAYRGRQRLRFFGVSAAVYAAWILRNELAAHQSTGRGLQWHPMSRRLIRDELRVAFHAIVTPGHLPSIDLPVIHAGLLVEILVGIAIVSALVRKRPARLPRIVKLSLGYGLIYLLFLVVTVSLFDASTPVDERLAAPIAPVVALTLAWLVEATPLLAVAIACLFGIGVVQQTRTTWHYGIDYSGQLWQPARLEGVRLPPGILYSNLPAAVAYYSGRSPRRIPQTRDPHTLLPNDEFGQQIGRLTRQVRTGTAGLVILDSTKFLEVAEPEEGVRILLQSLGSECRHPRQVVVVCARS